MEGSTQVPAHLTMWNPLAPIGRSWRRLRRRPRAMQIRTALIIVAIVVGLVAWLGFALAVASAVMLARAEATR